MEGRVEWILQPATVATSYLMAEKTTCFGSADELVAVAVVSKIMACWHHPGSTSSPIPEALEEKLLSLQHFNILILQQLEICGGWTWI